MKCSTKLGGWLVLMMHCISLCGCEKSYSTLPEGNSVDNFVKKYVTHCVGRYLVSLPAEFEENLHGDQNFDGVDIVISEIDKFSFLQKMKIRRNELEEVMTLHGPKSSVLKEVIIIDDGLIFNRAASENSNVSRILELHAWKNGFHVEMSIDAIDVGYLTSENSIPNDPRRTTTGDRMKNLIGVFNRTSTRGNLDIPKGGGACIINGFVAGPTGIDEVVASIFYLKNSSDTFFKFETDNTYTRDDSLQLRGRKADAIIRGNGGEILRRGPHDVAGVSRGEDFLYTILGNKNDSDSGSMSLNFSFEGNNKIGSAATTLVTLDFEGIMKKNDSAERIALSRSKNSTEMVFYPLSISSAVVMWDMVLPTIKPRPGAF